MPLIVTCCLLGLASAPDHATPLQESPGADGSADRFFDDSSVRDVHVTMSARDWATLKENYLANTYYPCSFAWNGIVMGNATLRSRGSGTRNPQKPGLRIDVNRYDSSQRFLGLKYFVLDNFWQDASMLRERVTMLLFSKMGIPVPRETFVQLYVNDQYAGLYAAVEPLDDVFVERRFGSADAYVYEYNWEREYHFEYLGPELAPYRMFDPKTHSKDPAALIWGPLEQMIRTMNEVPDPIFVQEVSPYIDLELFTRQIALENFMADLDGLLGEWGLNNFYLYRPPDSVRFQVLQWDKDNAFDSTSYPILKGVEQNVLARRTLHEPAFMDLYFQTLLDAASAVEAKGGQAEDAGAIAGGRVKGGDRAQPRQRALGTGWLEREILREYRQIRELARTDPFKPVSNDGFEAAIDALLQFAEARPAFVRAEVARMRATR